MEYLSHAAVLWIFIALLSTFVMKEKPHIIVVDYYFQSGSRGGTLLDPGGSWVSAVEALGGLYGARLDWIRLINALEGMQGEEPRRAAEIARSWKEKYQ